MKLRLVDVLTPVFSSLIFLLLTNTAYGRNIYLNGTDISSARNQLMENVNINIDAMGNIFIIAPQYQVNEESTYIPLSSWNQAPGKPVRKEPGAAQPNPENLPSYPAKKEPEGTGQETPKAGTKSKPDTEVGEPSG